MVDAAIEIFDPAQLAPLIQRGDHAHIHDLIPGMDDDELGRCYSSAVGLQRSAWLVQAHALYEANRRRKDHNDTIVADLYRSWGVSKNQAHRLIAIWELLNPDGSTIDGTPPLPRTFYHVVVQTDDPQYWLDRAEEERAADPTFTVKALREMIAEKKRERDEAATVSPPSDEPEHDAPSPVSALTTAGPEPSAIALHSAESLLDSEDHRRRLRSTSLIRVYSALESLVVATQQLQAIADPADVAALLNERDRHNWSNRVAQLGAIFTYCSAIDSQPL